MTTWIYQIIPFLRTTMGRTVLLILSVVVVIFFVNEHRQRQSKSPQQPSNLSQPRKEEAADFARSPITISNRENFSKFRPAPALPPIQVQPIPQEGRSKDEPLGQLVFSFSPKAETVAPVEKESEPSLPVPAPGSLLLCQLVNDLSSDQEAGPVIAVIREDYHAAGKLIIPNSSRVFGAVAKTSQSSRLDAEQSWKILTPDNREISITATIMSSETPQYMGVAPSLTTFSKGLPGERRKPNPQLKRKAMLSTLSGALLRTGQTGVESILKAGSQNNIRELGRETLSNGADQYSDRLFDELLTEKNIINSPAGQFFYLFVGVDTSKSEVSSVEVTSFDDYLNQRTQIQRWMKERNDHE